METNALPGVSVIDLPAGIYTLTLPGTDEDDAATGDLDIIGDLIIRGAGRERTIIDAGGVDRVFEIHGSQVEIEGITIRNGKAGDGPGGGIAGILSDLRLSDVNVSNNTGRDGGGIATILSRLELNNVILRNNKADRDGGGLLSVFSRSTLNRVTVSDNSAGRDGGGMTIFISRLLLTDSAVRGNRANRDGGGIDNYGVAALTNSAVHGNTAGRDGGGSDNYGELALTNSTISSNAATDNGGGIFNREAATLLNTTISHNGALNGGGIFNAGATLTLKNTLVANSPTGGDCGGPSSITSDGHNLSSDDTCHFKGVGDLNRIDPALGPLQRNGGPTVTHALLPGSVAIDAGDNQSCPLTDQRAMPRPVDGNADGLLICDIGAYELQFHARLP